MTNRVSECNGCAECIRCGRKERFYTEFYCDKCGYEIDMSADIGYRYNGRDLCGDCFAEVAAKELNAGRLVDEDD